jgi:hypothetical protein
MLKSPFAFNIYMFSGCCIGRTKVVLCQIGFLHIPVKFSYHNFQVETSFCQVTSLLKGYPFLMHRYGE